MVKAVDERKAAELKRDTGHGLLKHVVSFTSGSLPRDKVTIADSETSQKKYLVQGSVSNVSRTERKILNQEEFDRRHGFRWVNLSVAFRVVQRLKGVKRWPRDRWIEHTLPWVRSLTDYKRFAWKNCLNDIFAGFIVAVIAIPQGLAYSAIVGLPPVYGLYSSIFGPLMYAILGSSRHSAPGPVSGLAIIMGSAVEQIMNRNHSAVQENTYFESMVLCKSKSELFIKSTVQDSAESLVVLEIVVQLTLMAGFFQLIFGIINAGILAVWLSDQLVQGLATGASVLVFTSQLSELTGVDGLPTMSEPFGFTNRYICFFGRVFFDIKWTPVLMSIVSIASLLLIKEVLQPRIEPYCKIKIPAELLLVVTSTAVCYFWELNTKYNLAIVGPTGSSLSVSVPGSKHMMSLVGSAFSVAIVGFVMDVSIAKLVSKKFRYEINANQEWTALGVMNIVSSLFSGFACGASLSRTMVGVNQGVRSQLATFTSVIVSLLVTLFAAQFLEYLPKCVLSCVVVVALKDLFKQINILPKLFTKSFIDFLIWFVTFLAVVSLNLNYGLVIGVAFALLTVVFRSQWAYSCCLGQIPGTFDYKPVQAYEKSIEVPGVRVFRFDAPLYFGNAELFLHRMHLATGLNPLVLHARLESLGITMDELRRNSFEDGVERTTECRNLRHEVMEAQGGGDLAVPLHHIVVDCGCGPYIDLMGVEALSRCYLDYQLIGIKVLFANTRLAVRQMFANCDFYDTVPKANLFVSVADAVEIAYRESHDKKTL